MRKAIVCLIIGLVAVCLEIAAVPQSYGFENGYNGFAGEAGYTTWRYLENADGQPAPCLRIKGISGVAMEVARAGFVGDFAAAGYGRLSMDLKIRSWFPPSGQPSPVPRIFIQRANDRSPWARKAEGFTPPIGNWRKIYVDFNPNWTDAQAQAAGWQVEEFGLPHASFQETTHNVFVTGFWLQVPGGAETHVLIDNYALGPALITTIKNVPNQKQIILPKATVRPK